MALSSGKIYILSGEESGDLHGEALIKALKKKAPGLSIGGMGGERMIRAGLDGIDSRKLSVVGIVEVIEKFPEMWGAYKELKKRLKADRPLAVVLIDFPDFNLKFAESAKKLGIPVIYYISPQVWAWRKGRIKKIAGLVTKMLVVFPFEVDIYKKAGVDVEHVGHPLAERVECALTREEARKKLGITAKKAIALLPGSRTGEIKRLLKPMLDAAGIIREKLKEDVVFLIAASDNIDDELLGGFLKDAPPGVKAIRKDMYSVLRAADAAIVTSGTATLETALIGTPMVILYKMSSVSYGIGKMLVGVEHIGLPNIVAGKAIVPELIQSDASPEKIAEETIKILGSKKRQKEMEDGFMEIKKLLGGKGASHRAADAIVKVIEKSRVLA